MSEKDFNLSEYTVEEMSELLENVETEEMPELSERIKLQSLKEIAPEMFVAKKPVKVENRIFKVIPMAAALVLVIIGAVIAFNELSVQKYEDITTTAAPTTQSNTLNPLLSALSSGNEKLIESLITNSLLLSKDCRGRQRSIRKYGS